LSIHIVGADLQSTPSFSESEQVNFLNKLKMLKDKENIFKLVILAILVVAILFWADYLSGNKDFYKRALENRQKELYSGVVIEKYIDSSQHGTPMLKFKSSTSIPLENSFWNEIEIGDSIVKIKGQAIITVYKEGKVKRIFDYNEYFNELIQQSKKQL
jgi:hypothetical protein